MLALLSAVGVAGCGPSTQRQDQASGGVSPSAGGDESAGSEAEGGFAATGGMDVLSEAGQGGAAGARALSDAADLYVSTTGSDSDGDGSLQHPFATLNEAAVHASTGTVIGFLPGEYVMSGSRIELPDQVTLKGAGGAPVTLTTGGAVVIELAGSGAFDGLRLSYFANQIRVSRGTLRVTQTQFGLHGEVNAGEAAILASGTASVVLDAPSKLAPWFWAKGGGRIVALRDAAKLTVNGGLIESAFGGSIFLSQGAETDIELFGVTMRDCDVDHAVQLDAGSKLQLDDVVLDACGSEAAVYVGGGAPHVELKHSAISRSRVGLEVSDVSGASVQLSDVALTDNEESGAMLRNAVDTSLVLRGVEVSGNAECGVSVTGSATALVDLGKLGDPGGNRLENGGVGDAFAGLCVEDTLETYAVGNTWLPEQQGASAAGQYVSEAGQDVEMVGPASGPNFRLGKGQKLWL